MRWQDVKILLFMLLFALILLLLLMVLGKNARSSPRSVDCYETVKIGNALVIGERPCEPRTEKKQRR